MENMKKPDWFELADNDQPAKRSIKAPKSALAVVATLALTTVAGWGFISGDDSSANASENAGTIQTDTSNSTSDSSLSGNSTTGSPSAGTSNTLPSTSNSPSSSANGASTPGSSASDEILPPSGNSREHDGDREGGEHNGFGERPDHEKKPGHEIGAAPKSQDDDGDHQFGDDD